jgi:hypothetical protein
MGLSACCRLDPDTLQTLGLEDFGGAVRTGLPFTTGAGPWLDSVAGVLLTCLRAALSRRWTGWVQLGGQPRSRPGDAWQAPGQAWAVVPLPPCLAAGGRQMLQLSINLPARLF